MTPDVFSGKGLFAGDMLVMVLTTAAALLTYMRIGFEQTRLKFIWPRMILGVGWTLLAVRYWSAFYMKEDIPLSAMSIVAVSMIAGGYSVIQLLAIRVSMQHDRDPSYWEHRVRDAAKGQKDNREQP